MTSDDGEILSAFADGETVDPARLDAALRDPEALPLLVTCALLRAEIGGDASRPSPAFYERMQAVLKPRGIRRLLRATTPVVPWPIAAAAAGATLIAGLSTGLWVGSGPIPPVPPPVMVLAPATRGPAPPTPPVPAAPVSSSRGASQRPVGPPRPTHILQFATAGEWREGL
jgi:hypothetical protein